MHTRVNAILFFMGLGIWSCSSPEIKNVRDSEISLPDFPEQFLIKRAGRMTMPLACDYLGSLPTQDCALTPNDFSKIKKDIAPTEASFLFPWKEESGCISRILAYTCPVEVFQSPEDLNRECKNKNGKACFQFADRQRDSISETERLTLYSSSCGFGYKKGCKGKDILLFQRYVDAKTKTCWIGNTKDCEQLADKMGEMGDLFAVNSLLQKACSSGSIGACQELKKLPEVNQQKNSTAISGDWDKTFRQMQMQD